MLWVGTPPTVAVDGAGNTGDACVDPTVARCNEMDQPKEHAVMRLVGYSDRLSVAPGETISFMVSSEHPTYRADVVRLIHGDTNPLGPDFIEEAVSTPVSGAYPGRTQQIVTGSYVAV